MIFTDWILLTQNLEKGNPKKETAVVSSNPCDILEDEIPFEIPENWCWCRLGDVCDSIKVKIKVIFAV